MMLMLIMLMDALDLLLQLETAKDPRDARWQWDVDKTRQFLDEQASFMFISNFDFSVR